MISDEELDSALQTMERIENVKQNYGERIEVAPASEKSRLAKEGQQAGTGEGRHRPRFHRGRVQFHH